jgi:hypothetical protein
VIFYKSGVRFQVSVKKKDKLKPETSGPEDQVFYDQMN